MFPKPFVAAFLTSILAFCPVSDAAAQAQTAVLKNRSDFTTASTNLSIMDFESIAPTKGFTKYPVEDGLTTNGLTFRTFGGGRFGAGMVYVLSASYAAENPLYNTGTGAILTWAPPNQPGNAYLDVRLPEGVTAISADLWSGPPYASSVQVTATTRDGKTQTASVVTLKRPEKAFVGFVSAAEITELRFQLPKGQTRLILDNLTFGKRAQRAKDESAGTTAEPSRKNPVQPPATDTVRPPTVGTAKPPWVRPTENPDEAKPVPVPAAPQNNPSPSTGTIAYTRGGKEIRLIAPDGTKDRRLWTHPGATEAIGINELAWHPKGTELAFSSGHDAIISRYHADIYTIKADGTGLRKRTNAPGPNEFGRYPKGTVRVTVKNEQPFFRQSNASVGIFTIYVVGAAEPQQITLPRGASRTLEFKSVADFGDHAQAIVAIYGRIRWMMPGLDVKAGQIVKAPDFSISGDGFDMLGAFRPVWRSDGSRISYRNSLGMVSSIPANFPRIGPVGDPFFSGENPSWIIGWDYGPSPNLAEQVLYISGYGYGSSIHRITEGGKHPGAKMEIDFGDYPLLQDIHWLPDGSGFVYANSTVGEGGGNLFRYDFTTKKVTPILHLSEEFATYFTISPDGRWIVFERSASYKGDKPVDLWIVGIDGTGLRLLVKNARNPAWKRQ